MVEAEFLLGERPNWEGEKMKVNCPRCGGSGTMSIGVTNMECIDGKWVEHKEPATEIDCITCKGSKTMDEKKANLIKEAWEDERNRWCDCGNPSGDVKYWEDGTHPHCSKHCYTCRDCGKITQVG